MILNIGLTTNSGRYLCISFMQVIPRFHAPVPKVYPFIVTSNFDHFAFPRKVLKSTGCPTKNYTLFWRAVSSLNFELGIKVRGVLESSGSQLFKTVPTFDF